MIPNKVFDIECDLERSGIRSVASFKGSFPKIGL